MSSEVEICNIALSHIRAKSINSLTESSLAAQQCKLLYPILRDQVLRGANWQFANKVESLAPLFIQVDEWAYAYQYPSDCLSINHLKYQANLSNPVTPQEIPYRIYNKDSTKVIGTNVSEVRAAYTARVTDPNLYDTQFILALSHLLASELAIPLVGFEAGRNLRNESLQLYQSYLAEAATSDMNEQFIETPDSEFITVRA